MKCVICENCGETIVFGDNVWCIDSVFEQDLSICCQDCAESYDGYHEARRLLSGDEYKSLKWVDVITDWRSKGYK
jgi:hypothetical protein